MPEGPNALRIIREGIPIAMKTKTTLERTMSLKDLNNVARICAELGVPFNRRVAGIVEQRDALHRTWSRGETRSGLTVEEELKTIRLGLQDSATAEQVQLARDALGAIGCLMKSFREAPQPEATKPPEKP